MDELATAAKADALDIDSPTSKNDDYGPSCRQRLNALAGRALEGSAVLELALAWPVARRRGPTQRHVSRLLLTESVAPSRCSASLKPSSAVPFKIPPISAPKWRAASS